jgi:PadR family transcriptional regulator, regulatory protein AphA
MNAAIKVPTPSVEYSLLGLLGERAMHGYELHQELCRKTGLGLVWTVKQAQLYAILAKLESEGLIAAEVVAQGNRPPRKVFHLTESGEAAYESWVRNPAPRRDFRLDFLAKLYFAQREGPMVAEELLAGQRKLCSSWVEEMRARSGSFEELGLDSLVYRYRIGQLEATLAWLDECSDYLGVPSSLASRGLS